MSVMSEIDGVMVMLDRALGSSTQYGESLTALSNDLVHASDRDQVRGIVESMMRATNQAASETRNLELRLAESRNEISELREALERTRAEALTDPLTDWPTAGISTRCCTDDRPVRRSGRNRLRW